MKFIIFTLVLLQFQFNVCKPVCSFNLIPTVSSQPIQSTSNNLITQNEDYEDDFAPMLLFLLIFALICIGAGIVLTTLLVLIVLGLIGAGILSASIIVGINKKSFSKGFKTFLVSTTTICGLLVGLSTFYILHETKEIWTLSTALVSGGISGSIAGIVIGFFIFYVMQKVTYVLKNKLNKA